MRQCYLGFIGLLIIAFGLGCASLIVYEPVTSSFTSDMVRPRLDLLKTGMGEKEVCQVLKLSKMQNIYVTMHSNVYMSRLRDGYRVVLCFDYNQKVQWGLRKAYLVQDEKVVGCWLTSIVSETETNRILQWAGTYKPRDETK